MRAGIRSLVIALVSFLALAAPLAARADDGGGSADVRVERPCTGQSTVRLRVRERDDALRVELDVRTPRRGTRWSVVLIHERRLVLRTTVRTGVGSGSLSVRRAIPDWPGRDTVVARAIGPFGEVCRATVAVREVSD